MILVHLAKKQTQFFLHVCEVCFWDGTSHLVNQSFANRVLIWLKDSAMINQLKAKTNCLPYFWDVYLDVALQAAGDSNFGVDRCLSTLKWNQGHSKRGQHSRKCQENTSNILEDLTHIHFKRRPRSRNMHPLPFKMYSVDVTNQNDETENHSWWHALGWILMLPRFWLKFDAFGWL